MMNSILIIFVGFETKEKLHKHSKTVEAEVLFKSNTKFEIINIDKIDNPFDTTKKIYEIILKEI